MSELEKLYKKDPQERTLLETFVTEIVNASERSKEQAAAELAALKAENERLREAAREAKEALQGAVDNVYDSNVEIYADYVTAGWRGTIETLAAALEEGQME